MNPLMSSRRVHSDIKEEIKGKIKWETFDGVRKNVFTPWMLMIPYKNYNGSCTSFGIQKMLNLHLIFSYHLRITWHHPEGALCLLVENQLFHKHRVWPYSNIHECGITPEEKWVFLLLKINVGYFQFQHQYVKTWKLSLSKKQTKTSQTENLQCLAPNKRQNSQGRQHPELQHQRSACVE